MFRVEGTAMHVDQSGVSTLRDDQVDATAVEQFWHYVLGRRRSLLVDRAYQLRVSLFNVVFMAVLLAPILASYYVTLTAETESTRVAPELKAFFAAQDAAQFRLVLAAAGVFLLGLFLVTIFETHRTAGAAFALKRQLEAVECGRIPPGLTLRREDNLVGMGQAFNGMVRALRDRTAADATELEILAEGLDQVPAVPQARETAARLRLLADRKRGEIS
jgi:hypothetical protein